MIAFLPKSRLSEGRPRSGREADRWVAIDGNGVAKLEGHLEQPVELGAQVDRCGQAGSEKVEAFAETLDARDLQILRERVLAEEPLTLAELGERFAVTRERVRQLEAKLVKRLRRFMEENLVDFEYYGPGAG